MALHRMTGKTRCRNSVEFAQDLALVLTRGWPLATARDFLFYLATLGVFKTKSGTLDLMQHTPVAAT